MDGRYSYQSSQFQVGDPLLYQPAVFEPAPRRFASTVGRFFYRLIVFCLIVGALGGVLFGLYRNDILLTIAKGAGVEAQYHSLEQRIGAPGWGTPRSIVLPKELPAAPAGAAADNVTTESPSKQAENPAPKAETVPAVATREAKASTTDGAPIVSLDSLPSVPAKGAAVAKSEPEPVSLSASPSTQKRAPETKSARAVPVVLRETPTARSVPAPKAAPKPEPKPEPVAKAEPAPKPEPPAPKVDPTVPRASDNPLKAAIRAAMKKQPKAE